MYAMNSTSAFNTSGFYLDYLGMSYEMAIPGFRYFMAVVNQLPGYIQPLMAFFLFTAAISTGFSTWESGIRSFIRHYLMSTAEIRSNDEMYNHIMCWVATQEFARTSRYFVAATKYASLSSQSDVEEDLDDDPESMNGYYQLLKRAPLQYTPAPGTHWFWWEGRFFVFEREEEETKELWERSEVVSISCFGRSPEPLKRLLERAREQYLNKDLSKTIVYRPTVVANMGTPSWFRCLSRPSRPLSTVVLDEKIKDELLEDMRDYLHPDTSRWYALRGIPYRRGYLLHGAPGTGKSSLSFALAGHFGLKVYVLSLASRNINEEGLLSLFSTLPKQCIILLEDIDTAGLSRAPEREKKGSEKDGGDDAKSKTKTETNDKNTGISFSGLLNAIDGVASHEGRVLILTTNHPEKLDEALIRPGRVDMKIEFEMAGKNAVRGLFENMYELDADAPADVQNYVVSSNKKSNDDVKEKIPDLEYKESIKDLAKRFAEIVPEKTFSPAEIQGFLIKHKRSPEKAVEKVDAWAKEIVEKKSKGRMV
ncbi:hypothetical protein RUND412_011328 [Rhizina undulata]